MAYSVSANHHVNSSSTSACTWSGIHHSLFTFACLMALNHCYCFNFLHLPRPNVPVTSTLLSPLILAFLLWEQNCHNFVYFHQVTIQCLRLQGKQSTFVHHWCMSCIIHCYHSGNAPTFPHHTMNNVLCLHPHLCPNQPLPPTV